MTCTLCVVDGCNEPSGKRRKMCKRHYYRWLRTGTTDPGINSPFRTIEDRLWARADCSDPVACWVWTGAVNNKGYGIATAEKSGPGRARRVYAHRLAWEVTHYPIPEGMHVDHICHERRCINPAHLRLATPAQNQANRSGASCISTTGHRGVYQARNGRFVAQAQHKHIGTFDTVEEAAAAASRARQAAMPFSVMDQAS